MEGLDIRTTSRTEMNSSSKPVDTDAETSLSENLSMDHVEVAETEVTTPPEAYICFIDGFKAASEAGLRKVRNFHLGETRNM